MHANRNSLQGKKILVTGAGGHLGGAIAAHLHAIGAQLYLVDQKLSELDQVAHSLGENSGATVSLFEADFEKEDSRENFVGVLRDSTERLDGIVHNAAFVGTSELDGWVTGFSEQTLETWRRAIEINVTAPFQLTQLMVPLLKESRAASIVSVASIHGFLAPDWRLYEGVPMSNPAAYSVSKAGLIQLMRWLSTTLPPHVRANSVSPGGIERSQPSKFKARYEGRTPMGRMGKERDVVEAISFLLSDGALYITGQNIVVDGGYSSW